MIAILKLIKATVLIVVAIALVRGDAVHEVDRWATDLGVSPHSKHLHEILDKLGALSVGELDMLGVATLLYAGLFVTEGVGLMLEKVWAEYLTVTITSSFIPLEIYELVHRESAVKAVVLVVNIAIAIYLVSRLRADKHWPFRERAR